MIGRPIYLPILLALTPSAMADVLTLEPSADNTLYETPSGDLSNGAGSRLFAGRTDQDQDEDQRRALLKFDLSAIPAGSVITSASLQLHCSRSISNLKDVSLHVLERDWGEAGSDASGQEGAGAPAQPGDATWLETFFTLGPAWNRQGGDFRAVPSATTGVGGVGDYVWTSEQMAADVASWMANPATNFGWLVLGDESQTGTAKRFDSRENSTVGNRPTLTIEYCPPSSPASWSNYGHGHPGTNGIPQFTASAPPVLCETITLNVENSSGQSTVGFLFSGLLSTQRQTPLGGDLLVVPVVILTIPVPAGGLNLPGDVPCDAERFCGLTVYFQVLQNDPGASQGVSFTPGLEMTLGS